MTPTQLPGFETPPDPIPTDAAEGVEQAHEIIAKAKEAHDPVATVLLFSGGNDSLVTLDACAPHADLVVHVNTGIGIEDSTAFARRIGASYGRFREYTPPKTYEELVLGPWRGMPGPGAHGFTYTMLKERCVEAATRDLKKRWKDRVLFLTGARKAESQRRMGTATETRRKGAQVWVNPLVWWPNRLMADYRADRELPRNEVSDNLHMSGECLCGAMAVQGPDREERAALKFFYPLFDKRLCDLEAECRSRSLPYTEWGVEVPRPRSRKQAGIMCVGCEGRQLSLDVSGD